MYIPLKVTTDYSLLKSLIKIEDLIKFCVQKNITSCGICDTNLFGSVEFYDKCMEFNIKPIIGLEVTLNENNIYLYAKNEKGYKNLLKINSIITERNASIRELQEYSSDILVIVPYQSLALYDDVNFYEDRFIGYKDEVELKNALIRNSNVVYVY